jgi:hypothetical protein
MKKFSFQIAIALLIVLSCKETYHSKGYEKQDFLSSWLIEKEDSMYQDLLTFVRTDSSFVHSPTGVVRAFTLEDSVTYLGRFSREAKRYCEGIQVIYSYKIGDTLSGSISLSIDYNKSLVAAIDSLLLLPVVPRHFKVEKYKAASCQSCTFLFTHGRIQTDSLRAKVENMQHPYVIKIFVLDKTGNQQLLTECSESLGEDLLGEELVVKKVSGFKYALTDTLPRGLFTITQLKERLSK